MASPTTILAPLPTPYRQIRALYTDTTITVYQAYSPAIALPAVAQQNLSAAPEFVFSRMTWIKPSWCWMMSVFTPSLRPAPQLISHKVPFRLLLQGPEPGAHSRTHHVTRLLRPPASARVRQRRQRGRRQVRCARAVGPRAQCGADKVAVAEPAGWDREGRGGRVGTGGDLEDRGRLAPVFSEPWLMQVGCYGMRERDKEVTGRRPCGGGEGYDARREGLSVGRAVKIRVEDGVVVHGVSLVDYI